MTYTIVAGKTESKTEPPAYIPMPTAVRHKDYYMEGGNLVIRVEDVLFNVWDVSFRRHSDFFKEVGAERAVDTLTPPGTDDEHPLYLEGIKSVEFERLLWIIYPQAIGKYQASTPEEWITVLNLATRWKFNDVRALAIKELDATKFDSVEKLGIMQKYNIDRQWGYSAIIDLCSRTHPLTVAEGQQLGIETSINVARVREKLEKWGRMKTEEVKKVVREVFELEEPKGK